jgi:two-component system response regulator TctD
VKLLLVEDNPQMASTLRRTLERQGFRVVTCDDGLRALERWRAAAPDVVLLDLSLPGRDGLDVLADARKEGLVTPVIVITARGTVGDKILGLNTGADDYLPKPFDLDELEARINALVRRHRAEDSSSAAAETVCGDIRLDTRSGAVYWRGQVLELSTRERAMLVALLQRPGLAVARERLLQILYPNQTDVQPEAVEVVAYRLRKRLSDTEVKLVTLRGLGYLIKTDTAP